MKKLVISAILVALVMAPNLVFGLEETTTGEGGATYSSPAPDWVIKKAKAHIINYVGEDYFEANLSLEESYRVSFTFQEDQFKIIYLYQVPFEEITEKAKEFIVWLDKEGNVFDYTGPRKPYQFSITKEEAIEIAKENGIENPVGAIIDTVYDTQVPPRFFGEYAWVVRDESKDIPCPETPGSPEPIQKPEAPGTESVRCGLSQKIAYIEVDTGAVLSVFTWTGEELIGGTLPPASGTPSTAIPTPIPLPTPWNLVPLWIIIIFALAIVVVIGVFLYSKKRQ